MVKVFALVKVEHEDTSRSGGLSVACGLLANVGLAWIWGLSAGVVGEPSDLVRDGLALLLPVGVAGAFYGAIQAYPGTGRRRAVVGILLASAAVVGLLVLLFVSG